MSVNDSVEEFVSVEGDASEPEDLVLYLVPAGSWKTGGPVRVEQSLTVGRAPDSDLVTGDARTSKHHAVINRVEGEYYLTDLGSLNGTWLNGNRVVAHQPVPLVHGDGLGMGGFEARALFCRPGSEPAAEEYQSHSEDSTDPPTSLESLADLQEKLTDFQEYLLRRLAPDEDIDVALRHFAGAYLKHPLAMIRAQNQAIRDRLGVEGELHVEPDDIPAKLLEDAIVLNGRTEKLYFPEAPDRSAISGKTYLALDNVEFLVHGDLFPSHLAHLDDPATFNYRELLVGHKYRTDLMSLLTEARAVGVLRQPSVRAGDARAAAVDVFEVYQSLYSPFQEIRVYAGELRTLGFFSREGGSCRHRSAALQLMLQEAGVRSRYVRGRLMGNGQHAWVTADDDDSGAYSLLLDPNFAAYGWRAEGRQMELEDGMTCRSYSLTDGVQRGATDPAGLGYLVFDDSFNTIWRPRQRRLRAEVDPLGQTRLG